MICSNIPLVDKMNPQESPQREFEYMYDCMTTHAYQFVEHLQNTQNHLLPIFDEIYVNVRKLLFDFFGSNIDVN